MLEKLFLVDGGLPCSKGTELWRAFAERRPTDFAFLTTTDLVDLRNSAFGGIAEWDAFSLHYGSCERCNAKARPLEIRETENPLSIGTRKIVHVDMDAFYASVEQRDDVHVLYQGVRACPLQS